MPEHVLVVGGGMEMPTLLRVLGDEVRTTVVCQLAIVAKLREKTGHERIIGLRADAPMREWLRMVRCVDEIDPFTRLASFAERDQDRAAAIGEALGLRMHSSRTIGWVYDKPSMRARLSELGVDDTPYSVVRDESELRKFVDAHGLPCIVKPVIGAGSIGVRRIRSETDIAAAFRAANVHGEWTRGGAFVERLHDGPQFSVEAFSEDGEHQVVCVTRKHSDAHSNVEVGHVLPAPLGGPAEESVATYVGEVLDALGIEFGPTHTEIVLTEEGPRIIETHTRLAGDELPYLVRDALGIDLTRYTVRQVLGETGLLEEIRAALGARGERPPRHEAIWYATTAGSGVLHSISGVDAVRAREGVTEVRLSCEPGTPVSSLTSSDSRLGFVRAHGATPDEALGRARDAVAALGFAVVLDTGGPETLV